MTPLNYGARGSPGTDMWARHGPLNLNQHRTWGEMNAGLIILRVASLGRDAQNESDGAALRSSVAAATPSRQQLRRSSQQQVQHYNLYSTQLVVSSSRGSTSRRDAEAPRGGTLAARSISSVAAASAPSQQHQLRRSSISSVAAAEAGDGSVPRR